MKRLAWMGMALAVTACGGGADEGASPSPGMSPGYGAMASPEATGTMPMGATSGDFAAEVVTVDQAAGTITVRESAVGGTAAGGAGMESSPSTLTVDPSARTMLGDVRAGDMVTITCSMSGMGGTGTTGTGTPGAMDASPGTGTTGGTGMTGAHAGMLSHCTTVTAVRKSMGASS